MYVCSCICMPFLSLSFFCVETVVHFLCNVYMIVHYVHIYVHVRTLCYEYVIAIIIFEGAFLCRRCRLSTFSM